MKEITGLSGKQAASVAVIAVVAVMAFGMLMKPKAANPEGGK